MTDREVPEAPALPEGWTFDTETDSFFWKTNYMNPRALTSLGISLERIKELLATHGLSIIGAKDRAVLEACAAIAPVILHEWTCADQGPGINAIAEAELSRRQKP